MVHYLYKITNKINGKYYIGVHSTENTNDGYLGSGIGINRARMKYGDDAFVKEILSFANTRAEVLAMERQLVTEEVVSDPASYNMVVGGGSAVDFFKQQGDDVFVEHQRLAGQRGAARHYGHMNDEQRREWHSKGGKAFHAKLKEDRKSTRLNSSHSQQSRMPSSA